MKMKKMICASAISSLLSSTMIGQTPTPPPRTARPDSVPPASASEGGKGAVGKVAYLNTARFTQDILELKVKLDALNIELEPKKKEVQALEEELKNLKLKIQSQGNTVTPQARNQWIEAAAEKEKVLKRNGEDYEALVRKRLAEVYQPIREKILKFLAGYCQQHDIVMVFEGGAAYQTGTLIWHAPATDITDDFIKEYNKANPATSSSSLGAKRN
jgi:Skp family chaperone for outer membrane proteins